MNNNLEEAIYFLVTGGCSVEFAKINNTTIQAAITIPEVGSTYPGRAKEPYDALVKALVFSLDRIRRCHIQQRDEGLVDTGEA
jgi:hypothetical protein